MLREDIPKSLETVEKGCKILIGIGTGTRYQTRYHYTNGKEHHIEKEKDCIASLDWRYPY